MGAGAHTILRAGEGRMTEGWVKEREERLREFFGLGAGVELVPDGGARPAPDIPEEVAAHLASFNIEWHVVPSGGAVPFDERYLSKLYARRGRNFSRPAHHGVPSLGDALRLGHARHQGRVVGVETTLKPRYLPGNRQFYGTFYGFEATSDPFAPYHGRANFVSGTRFAHNYISLREFVDVVNRDWRERRLMPAGYRLTVCPPAVFNLVGTIFHPEWSETEALEIGFYRDDHDNATCYAVGSNGPGDYSYVHEIETDSDWTLLGFRTALVPE